MLFLLTQLNSSIRYDEGWVIPVLGVTIGTTMLKVLTAINFLKRIGHKEVFHAAPLIVQELESIRTSLNRIIDLVEDVLDENTEVNL